MAALSFAAPGQPYSIDNPYHIPAKPNGLTIDKPNMIIFMPDQLRYDSVGCFGNDVSAFGLFIARVLYKRLD